MRTNVIIAIVITGVLGTFGLLQADNLRARDPGVRGGDPGAGGHLVGLTDRQIAFFEIGLEDFAEDEDVGDGLGPRFNFTGCRACHSQPATGGTSPAVNPLVDVPTDFPGNFLPSFITPDGPIREARFKYNRDGTRDGGVHNLFVISGHPDAAGCEIRQEDFAGCDVLGLTGLLQKRLDLLSALPLDREC
jgi:hypothetical protein